MNLSPGRSWRACQRREARRQLEDGGQLRGTEVRDARGSPGHPRRARGGQEEARQPQNGGQVIGTLRFFGGRGAKILFNTTLQLKTS